MAPMSKALPTPTPPPPPPPPPSPPYLVIVLGDVLTRRCAPAGITEGVDERVDDSTTSFAVEIAPPHRRRLLPSRSTSTTREVSFARAWLSLGDDARRRGRRLHERDAASLFGTRMTSGCRSSFLREACKNRGSMVGVHLHGARGGAKALVFKHNGFLLRRTRGRGEQRGGRSRRKRSLIVTFPTRT